VIGLLLFPDYFITFSLSVDVTSD